MNLNGCERSEIPNKTLHYLCLSVVDSTFMSAKNTKKKLVPSETDIYSPAKRSLIMSKVRSKGTAPELAVRAALRMLRVNYRVNRKDLPGRPDIVISAKRLVIFVHGCFWHGHDCPKGLKLPQKNFEFWNNKIAETKIRDKVRINSLAEIDWRAAVVWECQTRNRDGLLQLLLSLI